MCRFKSGVIFKNRVVLAPDGNESHSGLLESLGIRDDYLSASTLFVRVELTPKNNNKAMPVQDWEYIVDQDIKPDWFKKDPDKYEQKFRMAVEEYIKAKNLLICCGYAWIAIKEDEQGTYYLMDGTLGNFEFGENNNYANSKVRNMLNNSELVKNNKLSREKFYESYYAWKNHISHGNCVKLGYEMDRYVSELLHKTEGEGK